MPAGCSYSTCLKDLMKMCRIDGQLRKVKKRIININYDIYKKEKTFLIPALSKWLHHLMALKKIFHLP